MDALEQKYNDTLTRLYGKLQAFHRVGSDAYKPGLDNVRSLAAIFGNPHQKFRTIHVGGTNGKGSTSHLLAAILSASGYKTGLYTSPHLIDFNERIRIDGKPISHKDVIKFVERFESFETEVDPSFFEFATIMAFDYFARNKVDVAIIEVGLGGRLDATNIITPDLSIVTNISLDHTAILGDTLEKIAAEKAGIFKCSIPAIVGEATESLREVFEKKTNSVACPLYFAADHKMFDSIELIGDTLLYNNTLWGDIESCLTGDCQQFNAATVLLALEILKEKYKLISEKSVKEGFLNVCQSTGLMARWMKITNTPTTICDTGHNVGAWQYLGPRLTEIAGNGHLRMVVGFVRDKDYSTILKMMPKNAEYYIVTPPIERAASLDDVVGAAKACDLNVVYAGTAVEGYKKALADSGEGDTIFVGGSTFVVAEMLALKR